MKAKRTKSDVQTPSTWLEESGDQAPRATVASSPRKAAFDDAQLLSGAKRGVSLSLPVELYARLMRAKPPGMTLTAAIVYCIEQELKKDKAK